MQKIYDKIAEVEANSQAEVVVIKHSKSNSYQHAEFFSGSVLLFVVFTFLMYMPWEIDSYLIYFLSILSFIVGFFAAKYISPIKRFFLKKKYMKRMVGIYARALFQKGNLHLTRNHTGILIYCSDFERISTIVVDKTVSVKVPQSELVTIQNMLDKVYQSSDFENNMCEVLVKMRDILSVYIPTDGNELNEIPDNLTIVL